MTTIEQAPQVPDSRDLAAGLVPRLRPSRAIREGRNRAVEPCPSERRPRVHGTGVRHLPAAVPLPRSRRSAVVAVRAARSVDLEGFLADWEDLAAHAAEPNLFCEPWVSLAALDAYGAGRDLRFVFVYEERDDERPLLCGVFPLERETRFRGLPIPVFRLWSYVHCYLGTPLLRTGHVRAALAAFFRWLRGAGEHALLEMPRVPAEGPVAEALTECIRRSALPFVARRWERAVFAPRERSEDYLREALRGKKRKEVRRLERRLADRGAVTVDELAPETGAAAVDAARDWAEEFLELEASGWKGRNGTALGCRPADRQFFRRIVVEAQARGRLLAHSLRAGSRPVAMKCNFLAGDGGFAFKIAYDEEYAQLSPGYLLEIETIRRLHRRPSVLWMDSCAVPGHPMADRLWTGRRALQTVLVATGGLAGRLLVPALSLARRVAHRAGRGRTQTADQEE